MRDGPEGVQCQASPLLLTWAPGQGGLWAVPRGPVDVEPDPMPGPWPLPLGQQLLLLLSGEEGGVSEGQAGAGLSALHVGLKRQIKDLCWCSLLLSGLMWGVAPRSGER